MLELKTTSRFRKEYRNLSKRGYDMSKLNEVLVKLQNEEQLDEKYQDHPLTGGWKGYRDCHIESDWVLIYKIDKGKLILTASRTGSHSDLF